MSGTFSGFSSHARDQYLSACRDETLGYIELLVKGRSHGQPAYAAVLEYPLREAKGLRPALTIASCLALGGNLDEIVPTAAALELCHNAFLVHDDIEDGSEVRRGKPTLSMQVGLPLAVHAGDTMLALVLDPLLENTQLLDVGRALRVLELVATMVRTTAEGQALELTWIREGRWNVSEADYVDMVQRKTAWYSFSAPLLAGAIVAEADSKLLPTFEELGQNLGVAFQIRDDVLNVTGDEATIGKETSGDLWEGKRTLILADFFDRASTTEATWAKDLLSKPRPAGPMSQATRAPIETAIRALLLEGKLQSKDESMIDQIFERATAASAKTPAEVERLRSLLEPSIEYASTVGERFADRARANWSSLRQVLAPSHHRDFMESLVSYVVGRDH
jgi:geranylgeranyl diphosphate synthase, type II